MDDEFDELLNVDEDHDDEIDDIAKDSDYEDDENEENKQQMHDDISQCAEENDTYKKIGPGKKICFQNFSDYFSIVLPVFCFSTRDTDLREINKIILSKMMITDLKMSKSVPF